ncbi:MAG TPA: hypothetical protein VFF06_15475 [Polyangia bacterium]|nr:hypothetical protein [Polyangia bacterium]
MRKVLYSIAALGLLGGLPACAHYDEYRADYHQRRANRAQAKRDYGTAEKQQQKADEARRAEQADKAKNGSYVNPDDRNP